MKFTAIGLFFSFALLLGSIAQADTDRRPYVSNVDGVEFHTVKWNDAPLRLALWYEKASGPRRQVLKESQVVLFVHGATISGKLSAGYPIDGIRVTDTGHTLGNGLGLSMVAAVARLHDLKLTVSDAGPGCQIDLVSTRAH